MSPKNSWTKSDARLIAVQITLKVCGGRGEKWPVECHEMWQYDDKNHVQKLAGLIALCPDYHKVKHIGYASIKRALSRDQDERFAYIAGYTNWGFPYGLIWEELEALESEDLPESESDIE